MLWAGLSAPKQFALPGDLVEFLRQGRGRLGDSPPRSPSAWGPSIRASAMPDRPKAPGGGRGGRPTREQRQRASEEAMGAHHVAISDPSSVTTGLNADVWIKHRENVETVLQSEMFEGVADRMPLEIDAGEGVDSGCMAPFNKEQGMAALAKTGRYMCAINLLWVDVYYTASGAVPILWASVEEIQKSYFSKPAGFMKLPIEI